MALAPSCVRGRRKLVDADHRKTSSLVADYGDDDCGGERSEPDLPKALAELVAGYPNERNLNSATSGDCRRSTEGTASFTTAASKGTAGEGTGDVPRCSTAELRGPLVDPTGFRNPRPPGTAEGSEHLHHSAAVSLCRDSSSLYCLSRGFRCSALSYRPNSAGKELNLRPADYRSNRALHHRRRIRQRGTDDPASRPSERESLWDRNPASRRSSRDRLHGTSDGRGFEPALPIARSNRDLHHRCLPSARADGNGSRGTGRNRCSRS